jgi:hypothetical protein
MINEEQNLTDAQMLRKKAEEQLKEKQKKVDISVKEADAKKLLHELQVHQIELEMQTKQQKLLLKNTLCCMILLPWAILLSSPMAVFSS